MEIKINVCEIRKTFTTIGDVRYIAAFQASEGNWCIERCMSLHKTEKSAQKKLDTLKAKIEAKISTQK